MKTSLSQTDRHKLAMLAVRVVDAEPADRERILAEATADRPDLREAVHRLIDESASENGDNPLADLAEVFRLALADESEDPFDQSGDSIDRYTLIERLGTGAYGAVYRAEQTMPVERQVALKLLHRGVGSPRVLRRFSLERRVLASLDHPGIARLTDAGTAPDGRPYFVMDLVEGLDLAAYCREHSLSFDDCVGLMAGVCDAVQHAHGRGVIHRDLKPRNILVRTVDGVGTPVVIDFGVARLLDPDPQLALTTLGHPIGTRRYMSPEQWSGGVVDARTDVYALGVTLTEVIATVPHEAPYEADPVHHHPVEVLTNALPRELRWIVGRCCQENPNDRYQTASELGADLRRFLRGQAVLSAPPSVFYRGGRLVARHPVPTALSLVAIAAIVGFAVYAQTVSVQMAREIAAQRQLITNTIDDVIDEIWVFMGSEDAREKLVGRLFERTEQLLTRHPSDSELLEIKARLLRSLGYFYEDRSDTDAMLRVSREAFEIYTLLAPIKSADVEFLRAHAEANVRIANALHRSGRGYTDRDVIWYHEHEAVRLLRDALYLHPGHIGVRDDLYWCLDRISFLLPINNSRMLLVEECFALAEGLAADSPDRILSRYALANAYNRKCDFLINSGSNYDDAILHSQESIRLFREIVRIQPNRGAFVANYANALANMLTVCRAQSNWEMAHATIAEADTLMLGLDPEQLNRSIMQFNIARLLRELALVNKNMGREAEAGLVYTKLISLSKDPAIKWSPQGRRTVEEAIQTMEMRGIPHGVGHHMFQESK